MLLTNLTLFIVVLSPRERRIGLVETLKKVLKPTARPDTRMSVPIIDDVWVCGGVVHEVILLALVQRIHQHVKISSGAIECLVHLLELLECSVGVRLLELAHTLHRERQHVVGRVWLRHWSRIRSLWLVGRERIGWVIERHLRPIHWLQCLLVHDIVEISHASERAHSFPMVKSVLGGFRSDHMLALALTSGQLCCGQMRSRLLWLDRVGLL